MAIPMILPVMRKRVIVVALRQGCIGGKKF